MDPRHILYVAQDSAARSEAATRADEALAAIGAAGWQVHPAADAGSAGSVLARFPIDVGVAGLDSDLDTAFRADMDALCGADAQLPWVALLPPEARHSDAVCRFVWESFYDYHTLPPDIERLLTTLGHAHGMAMIARAAADPLIEDTQEAQMVGVGPPMQAVFRNIRKMAAVDAPVLITGESGTGKELAARAVHERSRRAAGPFVAVNCAALPPTLIQSELFGHEKGAFTGAERRKIGSIEAANGGTLFLDEIGDLSLPLQVNLLRFLEGSTIQRVGSPKEIRVDVRVIAATHTDMEQATASDAFREDLYFRLNVLRLEMPALRMRGEDIEVLAQFFFKQFARESAHRVKGFSPEALRSLVEYDWPGNVRELINRVRRATVMCDGRLIRSADLGFDGRPRAVRIPTLEEVRAVAERDAILTALRGTGNNMSQAARALGTSRPRLYRLMARYDLQV